MHAYQEAAKKLHIVGEHELLYCNIPWRDSLYEEIRKKITNEIKRAEERKK
jgi:hypothetical protein